ncbi:hypothetical protein ABIE26_001171 [Pedobacter africanus]|uniref:Uncharacterized protein n=1 Tax=Pedobacter africanus TaxID=151894 RepID=A0ACC6KTB7_9SPHI|nr:RagB/SusD family nutrient uptake outer membrane protein [Pedobacter africanus]MDR6782341.1 hypothetical protein [Pedobacter africanus]
MKLYNIKPSLIRMKILSTLGLLSLVILLDSCEKFLEIDVPKENLTSESIFTNDELASSAVAGMYSVMATGLGLSSISSICGLTADEFLNYNQNLTEFYENEITPINTFNNSNYSGRYNSIYSANSIIEGLAGSKGLTTAAVNQLKGEALFVRAFNYLYLVNLFGPVPLQLSTDYKINRTSGRASTTEVYSQIVKDLKEAEELLTDKYYTTERVRPNLAAVQALLARTYLYTKDWANAEKYATLVIDKSSIYSLTSLDNVFLKNSQEAIWQLFPTASSGNTAEGVFFIIISAPNNVSLATSFVTTAFESGDKRRNSWVGTYVPPSGPTYYYPNKYKLRAATPVNEYSMVLRLAEQYLIRAEARAMQENLPNAIKDIDAIRIRAGAVSNNTGANATNPFKTIGFSNPDISRDNLLLAIQKERRIELFSEWGHRWIDLKRTGQADNVLKQIKPKWQSTDVLYPIPYNETSRNPNVGQNLGY